MKAIILSVLSAAALALSATAQDYGALTVNTKPGITTGMTFTDVIAARGKPASVDHLYSHPDMAIAAWGEPARVNRS